MSIKNKDISKYINFEKFKSEQDGLVKKTDFLNFLKFAFFIEMIKTKIEIVYNLDNLDEIEYIELTGYITCRRKVEDMKIDKIDLIYRKIMEFDERFVEINHKFDQVNEKFDQVNKKFDKIDERLDNFDKKINKMESKFDKRFVGVNKNFTKINKRLSNIETRLSKIEKCPTIQKEIEKKDLRNIHLSLFFVLINICYYR